jgi:hypothetical protein
MMGSSENRFSRLEGKFGRIIRALGESDRVGVSVMRRAARPILFSRPFLEFFATCEQLLTAKNAKHCREEREEVLARCRLEKRSGEPFSFKHQAEPFVVLVAQNVLCPPQFAENFQASVGEALRVGAIDRASQSVMQEGNFDLLEGGVGRVKTAFVS